jgi:hypothetical protein
VARSAKRDRKRRPNLDERFSLHPLKPEDVLRRLLKGKPKPTTREESEDQDQPEPES